VITHKQEPQTRRRLRLCPVSDDFLRRMVYEDSTETKRLIGMRIQSVLRTLARPVLVDIRINERDGLCGNRQAMGSTVLRSQRNA